MIAGFGIVGLAAATACSATLNCVLLYAILHKRGWFRFTADLGKRIARQLLAAGVMSALLFWLMSWLEPYYSGSVIQKIWSLALIVGAGGAAYAISGWFTGALDREQLAALKRSRAPAKSVPASE